MFNKLLNDILNIICEYLQESDIVNLYKLKCIHGCKYLEMALEYNKRYCDGDEDTDAKNVSKYVNFGDPSIIDLVMKYYKLKFFSKEIKQDKNCVTVFIKHNYKNLKYAHVKFLDDKDIILLVARHDGSIVHDISERLADDEDIIKIAVVKTSCAIYGASQRLQDKYIVKKNNVIQFYFKSSIRVFGLYKTYFMDESLTDNKYVLMRNNYNLMIENEKKAKQQEN